MWRNIVTLLSGNALAQLVNVVTILFVVSHFFSPEQFGRYAVLMSYIGILSVVACFRYDVSIVSVSSEVRARNLAAIAVMIAAVFGLATCLIAWVLVRTYGVDFLFGVPLVFLSVTLMLKALGQVLAGVLYRHEKYATYSAMKLVQALVLLAGFLLAGWLGIGVVGMMAAVFASYLTFALLAGFSVAKQEPGRGVYWRRMFTVARRERDFMRFNTPQALIDTLLSNGVNIMIIAFSGAAIAGYYSFMQRAVRAPLALVFGAVSQVVFRFTARNAESPDLVRAELRRIAVFVVGLVGLTGVAAMLVFYNFGWLAFLSKWQGMRDYIPAFSAWLLVPFIFSPFATLPIVYGRQKSFFVIATSFNLAILGLLGVFLSLGFVAGAFYATAGISSAYFLAMSAWVYRITADEATG